MELLSPREKQLHSDGNKKLRNVGRQTANTCVPDILPILAKKERLFTRFAAAVVGESLLVGVSLSISHARSVVEGRTP